MKIVFILSISLFLYSCVSKIQKTEVENVPLSQADEGLDSFRNLASEDLHFENSYKRYFDNATFYERLQKLRSLAYKLNEVIPEKGHPRKNLLLKFIRDYDLFFQQISADGVSQHDIAKSWKPTLNIKNSNYKIRALGKIVRSAKVMDRLGIFLTASQVMEEDSKIQNFYYSLMSKAISEIDSEISGLILIYKIEDQEADLQQAQIDYSKYLANLVRSKLHRVYDSKNTSKRLAIESVLKKIDLVKSSADAKKIIKNSNWIYVRAELSKAESLNSSDIEGFREDEDVKIATYFSVEMIENLYQSIR